MEGVLFLIMVPSLGKKLINRYLERKSIIQIDLSFLGFRARKEISGGGYLSLKTPDNSY
jgi:hypothetical protein